MFPVYSSIIYQQQNKYCAQLLVVSSPIPIRRSAIGKNIASCLARRSQAPIAYTYQHSVLPPLTLALASSQTVAAARPSPPCRGGWAREAYSPASSAPTASQLPWPPVPSVHPARRRHHLAAALEEDVRRPCRRPAAA